MKREENARKKFLENYMKKHDRVRLNSTSFDIIELGENLGLIIRGC